MTIPKDKSQEGPYSAAWENGFCVVRDANAPEGSKIMMTVPDDMHWLAGRLNAAYAAGQAAKSSELEAQPAQAGDLREMASEWHRKNFPHFYKSEHPADLGANEIAVSDLAAFARSLTPSPSVEQRVEEIMGVVEEWYASSPLMPMPHSTQYEDLRERLASLLSK